MLNGERWLRAGALLTGVAALLHLGIIFGGPEWYRFFGAGERMARLSAGGSSYPAVVTAGIASILGLWGRVNETYARVLGEHRPARAVIPTKELNHGFLIEIDAIAATYA